MDLPGWFSFVFPAKSAHKGLPRPKACLDASVFGRPLFHGSTSIYLSRLVTQNVLRYAWVKRRVPCLTTERLSQWRSRGPHALLRGQAWPFGLIHPSGESADWAVRRQSLILTLLAKE